MADTTFVDGTVIEAAWLNDVNDATYTKLTNVTTISAAAATVLDDASTTAMKTTLGAASSGDVTASGLTMSTAKVLGRSTASTGAIEEISIGSRLSLSAGSLNVQASSATQEGAVELATTAETQTGTDTARAVTPAGMQASKLISMGQTTASTGVVQFSSIPSWAKRITIQVDAVSPSTTALVYVQLGDSGGLESSGYASTTFGGFTGSSVSAETRSDGFFLNITGADAATNTYGGTMVLTLMDAASFKWIATGTFRTGAGTASGYSVAGYKNLTAALDRVALVTSAGTFDAGSVNVIYE